MWALAGRLHEGQRGRVSAAGKDYALRSVLQNSELGELSVGMGLPVAHVACVGCDAFNLRLVSEFTVVPVFVVATVTQLRTAGTIDIVYLQRRCSCCRCWQLAVLL